ncbi:hypothetical protein DCCM_2157 [Desulfocucumis palustris]|uniref:Uncharacterized protein n=1 Tax=Desulfocucumis palustris TaxID=1898651 RepID=A0A2L2XAF1_9FIRM|nr:hypothetical protein [Desulfocucumis palustris]GBF33060.1 hypothetical protein DCCM_2157 [Desulfocucumis palustris]
MQTEVKHLKKCPINGREITITLLYRMEGTRTCQVACTPLSWRCSAENHCGGKAVCSLFKDFLTGGSLL